MCVRRILSFEGKFTAGATRKRKPSFMLKGAQQLLYVSSACNRFAFLVLEPSSMGNTKTKVH